MISILPHRGDFVKGGHFGIYLKTSLTVSYSQIQLLPLLIRQARVQKPACRLGPQFLFVKKYYGLFKRITHIRCN